jgi:hypothetical protein
MKTAQEMLNLYIEAEIAVLGGQSKRDAANGKRRSKVRPGAVGPVSPMPTSVG